MANKREQKEAKRRAKARETQNNRPVEVGGRDAMNDHADCSGASNRKSLVEQQRAQTAPDRQRFDRAMDSVIHQGEH